MGQGHDHSAHLVGRRLGLSLIVTLAFVASEGIAGYLSNSLALISDAGHNFADALALLFSWYAIRISRRPPTAERTYGYHRVSILTALVNALSLVAVALLIFWEAISRLRVSEPVKSVPMIVVALVAVVMNTIISFWLRSDAKHDLNVRSAYLHMVGDAVSAAGVVVAGIFIVMTGSTKADPVVSILIAALILASSWGILKEAINVLLEAIPKGMDMKALELTIGGVPGVLEVHDLHVWTVGSGVIACSCHVLVTEQSVRSGEQVLRTVTKELEHNFGITHTTIQLEVEGCEPNDIYCVMKVAGRTQLRHRHH
jgi:cobalt-zinc-cadmium efflux system protein